MNRNWQQNRITDLEWAQYKRMTELYSADSGIRKRICENIEEVLQEWDFQLDPVLCKEAIFLQYQQQADTAKENPYYREYVQRFLEIGDFVNKKHAPEYFADSDMWKWNQTVSNRLRMENRYLRSHRNIRYYPVNFELSDGCSVQCPFCGIAAPRWKADFLYTKENATLWREVLQVVREQIGEISSTGICYFATEPMDNPDYEKFLLDYYQILGDYPQTTTAVADRCPERIRDLIRQIGPRRMRYAAIRFSVRTLPQFYRIMKEFSAEELKDIEVLTNNPESDSRYAVSGRTRENVKKYPADKLSYVHTISCVAGYKINMANKTVTFMEPERPSDRYPNGIREYECRQFDSAAELKSILHQMSKQWVMGDIPIERPLCWNSYITISREERVVYFTGDHIQCKLTGNLYFYESIKCIEQHMTFEEICAKFHIGDLVAADLMDKLNLLYHRGYLQIYGGDRINELNFKL